MTPRRIIIDCPPNFRAMLDNPAQAATVIDGARERIGIPVVGPITTIGVLIVAQALGYDCQPPRLWKLLADGRIPEPPTFGVEMAWETDLIAALLRVLHDDRAWLPLMHTASKNRREKNADEALLKQCRELVDYYGTMATGELEVRFEQTQDLSTRNVIARLLRDRYADAETSATERTPCEPTPNNR